MCSQAPLSPVFTWSIRRIYRKDRGKFTVISRLRAEAGWCSRSGTTWSLTRTSWGAGRTTRLVSGTLTGSSGWETSSSGRWQMWTITHTMSWQWIWRTGQEIGDLLVTGHLESEANEMLFGCIIKISTMAMRVTQCTGPYQAIIFNLDHNSLPTLKQSKWLSYKIQN